MTLLPILAALLLAALAALAWRAPTLRRLAVRNARRRRGEALLVVAGCAIGTAIVTSALLIGDSLDASLRDRANTQLGPADVVVRGFAAPIADGIEATLLNDSPKGADGVLPVTAADATLATPEGPDGGRSGVASGARLLELDFAEARGFGGDPAATGINGATPGPDEVVLGEDAAEALGVGTGSGVEVHAYGQFRLLRVARVLPGLGLAGLASGTGASEPANAFVAPGTIGSLAYGPGVAENSRAPERLVLVSAAGGVFPEAGVLESLARGLEGRLSTLPGSEVEPVKADLLRTAEEEAASFAELFLSLGSFAAIAGVALLVNALVTLAEGRRRELGVMLSLGMRRRDVTGAFVLEGGLYAVAASVLGTALGVGVGWLVVRLAGGLFSSVERGGVSEVRLAFGPETLLGGACVGLVVSLAVVTGAGAWISRMTVVEAIRDHARIRFHRPPRPRTLAATALLAVALVAGSVWAVVVGEGFGSVALPPLALAALAALGLQFDRRRYSSRPLLSPRGRRLVTGGVALASMGWAGLSFAVLGLGGGDVVGFVAQGLVLTLGAVYLLSGQGGRIGTAFGGLRGRVGLVLRLALAYPTARRWRTATALLAYGLVVFTLVFSFALSGVFESGAAEQTAREGGGFDVLVSTSAADPVKPEELAAVEGVEASAPLSWTVADFRVVGEGDASGEWAVSGFDRRLLDGGPPALEEFDEAAYPDEGAVWEAVLDDPNLAIADVAFLQRGGGPPEGNVELGQEIEVRDPQTGEAARRRIAAISAAGAGFSGVMVSRPSLEGFVRSPVENRHYVAVGRGADPEAVVAGLEEGFLPNSLQARSFRAVVEEALRDQEGFFDLIEGYLALGLVVGTIGFGVVAARSALERRRQVAVLLGLGLPASSVRAVFLVESGLVALEGAAIGAVLALVACRGLVTGTDVFGETSVPFAVPWGELGLLLAAVLAASLLAALPAAVRASAVSPASALRASEEGAA